MDQIITFAGRPGREGHDSIAVHNMAPFVVTPEKPEVERVITDRAAQLEGYDNAEDFCEFLFGEHGVYNANYDPKPFSVKPADAQPAPQPVAGAAMTVAPAEPKPETP